MTFDDRKIAGIRCSEILAQLSGYMEGELAQDTVNLIREHVKICHQCEQFGGEFVSVIKTFRETLSTPPSISTDIQQRLKARLVDL
ncbi:MAG: zf-HC2 domain-containing protein [SAR324 cluster bacterium]|nr:zf-HC2 domain-containing protein [SAR324 cluster bacterium]